MKFYFQKPFIKEVKKLLKKESYKDCEEAIIENLFLAEPEEIFEKCAASRLNTSSDNPFAKIRINSSSKGKGKSSSYRLYLMVFKVKGKMYFAYLHPKTGVYGKQSLNASERKEVVKTLIKNIKENNFEEVSLNDNKDKIIFNEGKKEVF
ncbi:hypothetical protein ULMS_29490 [Patiriisocius marinistellae]|uniref:Addiction module toxin RelE n=1 Tax=Patiriisocius marinistellae TaxID=2494560 RepID=A0A5J4G4E8_9FLAO|nr:hypothetical protein [Patiriisocius marinistellae]GEQ87441.1 hypothetical protein ULMS_29490 [Patiriisocius marinistellae]